MPNVDIRWRPSGGRGEYEHVPQAVLLERRIIVDAISVPGAYLTTDAWGKIRDGKPRLRREHPNDRSLLNVPQLIAALALLPDPIREDQGKVVLPLRDKGYVISSISFLARHADGQRAICTPQSLRVLHDNNDIDLVDRLMRIADFMARPDLPTHVRVLTEHYQSIVRAGVPVAELRNLSNGIAAWLNSHAEFAEMIEAPSEKFVESPAEVAPKVLIETLTANETKRRLVSHFSIDRNRKIRTAKVAIFKKTHDQIFCENCAFDFEQKYGNRGKGFIEVHHLLPLAALLPNTITNLSDLMLLCANCHRIVHRKEPLLDKAALGEITRPWLSASFVSRASAED